MKNKITITIFWLMSIPFYAQDNNMKELVPPSIDEFAMKESQVYGPDELYSYINGGAELYLSYKFQNLLNVKYRHNDNEILLDIFDMGGSKNAYGVFTHAREEINSEFGNGAQVYDDALIFWKGSYYVSIMFNGESDGKSEIIRRLARFIDSKIQDFGEAPEITDLLSKENLAEESVIYFFNSAWQNSLFYLSNENLYSISDKAEAVWGRYSNENEIAYAMIVKYEDPASRNDAVKSLESFFEINLEDKASFQFNEKHATISVYGNHIISVFQSGSSNFAEDLLNKILLKIRQH